MKIIIYHLLILFCCEKSKKIELDNSHNPITALDLAKGILYEVNIRQFTNEGTFKALEKELPKIKTLGVNILWLMPTYPISTTKSKGPLGSYYAVSDYKGVNPEYGTLNDLKSLVNKAHEMGMFVIFDWVPGHTGWDHIWIKEHPEFYLKNALGKLSIQLTPEPASHLVGPMLQILITIIFLCVKQ